MIRRLFLALGAAVGLAGIAAAQDAGDILVIEIAGEANGIIEIELLADLAPLHVARIKELARSGAYDSVVFHRVIDGFMAQTGDLQFGRRDGFDAQKAGRGGSDLPDLPAEFSGEGFVTGIMGMARGQNPDSANSQFFIMLDEAPFLDGQYTVLGRVIAGQSVVDAIKRGSKGRNGAVENPDYMAKVTIKGDR